jgi:hypothetical protein
MSEKAKHSPQRELPIGRVLIGAIVLLLLWIGLGINLNFDHSPIAFENARSKWEASNIRDYEMKLSIGSMVYVGDIVMLLEDNQIISMTAVGSPLGGTISPIPIDLSQDPSWYSGTYGFSSYLAPSLQDYEVERLFEFTESILPDAPLLSLCNAETRYELEFNQQYGFVEEISSVSCGMGWLCATLSHCQAGFRIEEFIP